MTNADILARPDVIAALQCWWDETRSFCRGITSGVVADLLEDYGWVEPKPERPHPFSPILTWMRLGPGGAAAVIDPGGDGPLHIAAGVFNIRTGTLANPRVYHMVQWMMQRMRWLGASYNEIAVTGHILVSEEDAGKMAGSREVREYQMQNHPDGWKNQANPLGMLGLPCTMLYGVAILLNECQTPGQIDMVCGERIVTARTVP